MLFFVWAIRRSETGVCSEKRDGDAQWFSERMFWLVQLGLGAKTWSCHHHTRNLTLNYFLFFWFFGFLCVCCFVLLNRYWGIVTVPGSFLKAGDHVTCCYRRRDSICWFYYMLIRTASIRTITQQNFRLCLMLRSAALVGVVASAAAFTANPVVLGRSQVRTLVLCSLCFKSYVFLYV